MRLRLNAILFVLICASCFAGLFYFTNRKDAILKNTEYKKEIEEFRNKTEERLTKDDSWLTVVGLEWLSEGENNFGSALENKIHLPKSTPAHLGTIHLATTIHGARTAQIKFATATDVTLDGHPVTINQFYPLSTDHSENTTQIQSGSVTFFLIERPNGLGVRIKDKEADALKNFKGLQWYPIDEKFKITAKWIAYRESKKIIVPDILGNMNEEVSPGYAEFQLNGETFQLHPTRADDRLFFVFRDQTSGKDTYGAARFLYSNGPENGAVILDFNRAVNPPCAFTHYATCPMPPKENILKLAVTAGEKKPPGLDH